MSDGRTTLAAVSEIFGDFEIHVTVRATQAEQLAAFAAEHELKFLHIELDRGVAASQPMLTLHSSGSLGEQVTGVNHWCRQLRAAGIEPVRGKIEATPWAGGVPQHEDAAIGEPAYRYFEHHIKLRLPVGADLDAITALVEPHGARLSRNARKRSVDGTGVRFVNQRCHRVGRAVAEGRLGRLLTALREAGHEVVSTEQEYVVYDDNLELDAGWLPVPSASASVRPSRVFDPALKHLADAYRPGEPVFGDPAIGERWRAARRAAARHILSVLPGQLVLRGSMAMSAWVGAAARDPGDLDFVVTPASLTSSSAQARELLDAIVAAVAAAPGAGLRPESVTESAIWTYERADGRRLVIPFQVPGVPDGTVQIDVVFGEELPVPPEPITLPGVPRPVLAATAGLSLAWKLLWLVTDWYPQGKDLYDAVLLAEHTTPDLGLIRDLMRPELGWEADEFGGESVLSLTDVQWGNFALEYPDLVTDPHELPWLRRLAVALDRAGG